MIKSLQESSNEGIPELLILPADDPYSVLKRRFIDLYNLSDYERAELLMALPQVDGDMPPSMLLNKMRALTPQGELEWPTSLLWYAFLSRLLPNIRVHCVPFVGVETQVDVAQCAKAQFRARPRPAALPQVCHIPREYGDDIVAAVQDAVNAAKARSGSLPQPPQLCFNHTRFGRHALKCWRPCPWTTAQGNSRGRN